MVLLLAAIALSCTGCKRRSGGGAVSRKPEVIREDPRRPGTRLTGIYHTLARGENLWQLSRMYGVDIAAVKGVNSIKGDPILRVGSEIFIPGTPNFLLAKKHDYLRGTGKTAGNSKPGTMVVADNGKPIKKASQPVKRGGVKTTVSRNGSAGANPVPPAKTPPSIEQPPKNRRPAASTRFDWPMKGDMALAFGKGTGVYANGVIIESASTDQVAAASSGTVEYSGNVDKLGEVVIISHELNYFTLYARIKRPLVVLGEKVQAGEPVAVAGREETGSQGPRNQVYFEIRNGDKPVDPVQLLR